MHARVCEHREIPANQLLVSPNQRDGLRLGVGRDSGGAKPSRRQARTPSPKVAHSSRIGFPPSPTVTPPDESNRVC